jgi:hypothetical protein
MRDLADRRSASVARRTTLRLLATLTLIAVCIAALLGALPGLPSLNPFATEDKDRSQPAILKSIARLNEFRAATANLQVVIDVERDAKHLPSFIKGERTLFVAAGNVDAAVDFAGLGRSPEAVRVSGDRKQVAITLPQARLTEPRLDQERSRVFDRDRGALDRIGEAFSDDGGADQQQLYVLAERKLAEAAASDPQLLQTAERNTRAMLEGMMRGLGFEQVTIRFDRSQV